MEFELTDAERAQWDVDPDEWPHTPPFGVFAALYDEDHNLWWRAGSGHGLNAYDAARQVIDDAAALADKWAADIDGLPRADGCARQLHAVLRGEP